MKAGCSPASSHPLPGLRSHLLQVASRRDLRFALTVSDRHFDRRTMCRAIAAHLVRALELDAAGPVAAGAVHERVHLRAGKAGQEDGLPVQGAAPRQEGLPHAHDVRAMLRLWQLVEGLKYCSLDKCIITQLSLAFYTAILAAGANMLCANGVSASLTMCLQGQQEF